MMLIFSCVNTQSRILLPAHLSLFRILRISSSLWLFSLNSTISWSFRTEQVSKESMKRGIQTFLESQIVDQYVPLYDTAARLLPAFPYE